jgi:hypothetical protein
MSVWNVQEPWTAKVLQRKEVVFFTDSAERFSKLIRHSKFSHHGYAYGCNSYGYDHTNKVSIALHRGKTSPIF